MKKVVTMGKFLLLAVAGLITVAPVLFLLGGSLMGDQELAELLAPAFSDSDGYAAWHWLPLYPTLRHYVQLCLDSPEYFQMFWNTMKITVGVLAGQIIVGIPGAWGLARYSFPQKGCLSALYFADASALSGDNAVRISGAGPLSSAGYSLGCDPAGSIFHLSGVFDVSFLLQYSGGNAGGGTD